MRSHAPSGIYTRAGRPGARVPGVDVPYEAARAPELSLDTKNLSVEAGAGAIVGMVTTRFLCAAAREKRDKNGFGRTVRLSLLLDDGTPEQKEISQRAREYLSERLKEAAR